MRYKPSHNLSYISTVYTVYPVNGHIVRYQRKSTKRNCFIKHAIVFQMIESPCDHAR